MMARGDSRMEILTTPIIDFAGVTLTRAEAVGFIAALAALGLAIRRDPLTFAAIIVALFTAFGAPGTGAAAASIIFGPVIALAWCDILRLQSRVRAFERETNDDPKKPSG